MVIICGVDANGKVIPVGVEPSADALYTSRAAHKRIENSNMWVCSKRFDVVAAEGYAILQIKTGSTINAHGHYAIMSEGKVYILFYENPTLNTDGTALTELCLNRQTTASPATACYHTPDISAYGTLLENNMLGTSGRVADMGGMLNSQGYWLLKKSEDYLVVVRNKDAAAKDICIVYVWHEH